MKNKFILFWVEGNNDEREISAILHTSYFKDYYGKYDIRFQKPLKNGNRSGGDITADKDVTSKNVLDKLNKVLMRFRNGGEGPYNNILVSDIQEIIHIVDLDGTFIPRSHIERGEDPRLRYCEDTIETSNVDACYGRNKKKAEILRKLIETKQIGNVPYSVYFVSANMDHLLFDERNLSQGGKNNRAFDFMSKCKRNESLLKESIFKPGIMAEVSYYESWEEIQTNTNSLKRRTNFNLFLGPNAKNPK